MSTFAAPIYAEANREHLLQEFARLRAILSGEDVPRAEMIPWESDRANAIDILTELFDLSSFERDLLLLSAAVEMDADIGELCGRLTGRPQRNCPTFGLALSLLPNPNWSALAPGSPLRHFRLVELEAGSGLAAAPLRIDERILHFLAGSNRMDARLKAILRFESPNAPLAEDQEALVASLLHEYGHPDSISLHLHGDDPAAQRTISARIARAFGRHLFILRAENAPAPGADLEQFLALWSRESLLLPAFLLLDAHVDAHGDAPMANICALAERISSPLLIAGRDPVKLLRLAWRHEVNRPEPAEQRRIWQAALAAEALAHDPTFATALDRMAEQFRMSAGAIAAIAATAAGDVGAGESGPQSLAGRLWQSCRAVSRPQLDLLAERIATGVAWDDLVLPDAQTAALKMLAGQARNRMTVYERWGFAGRGRRGLGMSALFSGPSGTGKTLAAEVLAAELDLDLYRIDLSSVVSKYIGETEKNLKKVFDAAEQGGVVLLFDEADALFGKRSEVRDSHDRYANIEVGYLLQRMEQFQGVAILTTNSKASLDKAFQRRLRFIIDFPYPGLTERERIWRRAIPQETPTSGVDPARLAQLQMAGGNIRNIALNGAFLAAEQRQPLSMRHLREAAHLEAAKTERPIAATDFRGWE